VGGSSAMFRAYDCTPYTRAISELVCEAGDLAGKHGLVSIHSNITFEDPLLPRLPSLEGLALAVQCTGSESYAFCGLLRNSSPAFPYLPPPAPALDPLPIVASPLYAALTTHGLSLNVLMADRRLRLNLTITPGAMEKLPGGTSCLSAGLTMELQQGRQGGRSAQSGCAAALGGLYDPALQCALPSANPLCAHHGGCVSSRSATPSPLTVGALTSRHGVLPLSAARLHTSIDQYDEFLPPPRPHEGPFLVLRCAATEQVALCAPLSVHEVERKGESQHGGEQQTAIPAVAGIWVTLMMVAAFAAVVFAIVRIRGNRGYAAPAEIDDFDDL